MVNCDSKKTDAGLIPVDWEAITLADVFVSLEAGVSVNSDEHACSNYYVLKSSSVSNGKFRPDEIKPVIPEDCKRVKCPVIGGSIIISRMNTPLLVGECGYVEEDLDGCFLPDRLWQARNQKPSDFNFKWLNYVLNYGMYRDAIRFSGTGTSNSMKNISKQSLLEVSIPKPSLGEQNIIAEALSDVDSLIDELSVVIRKLQNLKKAYLCELFPHNGECVPSIRIPGCTKSWKLKKLGECLDERQERSSSGELISVTINDGIKRSADLGRWDNSSDDKSNYKKVEKGDIVYNTMRMWQGASGYSPYSGIVSPAYTVLSPKQNINSAFFACAFKQHELICQFQIYSQGMTSDTWNLRYPILCEIETMVPDLIEQQLIAEHFAYIDELIAVSQQKLQKYVWIKQGMMSKLLTGKIRLV